MALALEEKYDQVRQLINMGKERGYLLYDEVNDILPAEVHSSEEIDDLLSTFERYGIDIYEDKSVTIRMTLTAPGCPVAGSLPLEVEKQAESVEEVTEADVVLVWEPAWDKSRMSEAAQLMLNI